MSRLLAICAALSTLLVTPLAHADQAPPATAAPVAPVAPAPVAPVAPAPVAPAPVAPAPAVGALPAAPAPVVGLSPPGATPVTATAGGPAQYTYAPAPGSLRSRRDPGVALGLSLGVTVGGAGLIWAGSALQSDAGEALATLGAVAMIVGPTTGHIYAGRTANPGLGVRAISGGVGVLGTALLLGCIFSDWEDDDDYDDDEEDDSACTAAAVLTVGGYIGYLAGTVYEIVDAPRAARRYNARHGLEVNVAPIAVRAADGGSSPGLAVAGRF